jgi:hypothetical protein
MPHDARPSGLRHRDQNLNPAVEDLLVNLSLKLRRSA